MPYFSVTLTLKHRNVKLLNKRHPLINTFKKIWVELVTVAFVTIGIVFIDKNFNINNYSLPMTIATIIGTPLSLVLAILTTQGYDHMKATTNLKALKMAHENNLAP